MKNQWIKPTASLMVISLVVACGPKKRDSSPTPVPTSSAPVEPPKQQPSQTQTAPPSGQPARPVINPESDKGKKGAPSEIDKSRHGKKKPELGLPPPPAPDQNPKDEKREPVDSVVIPTEMGEYTGAAPDYMRQYLEQKLAGVEEERLQKRNQDEAEKIKDIRLVVDKETGDVALTVVRRSGGKELTTVLGGAFQGHGIAHLVPQEEQAIRGSLICLDRNTKTCHSSRIRLEIGEVGGRGIVNVIYRRTGANFDYRLPATLPTNHEFARFVDLFYNTEAVNGRRNSLRSVLVDSFEVINGRSGVRFSLTSYENEVITASGPLVDVSQTVVTLGRERNFEDLIDLENGRSFYRRMHDTISEVHLVGNDRRAELTLLFVMRPDPRGQEESLNVTFVRQHRGIISLEKFKELERLERPELPRPEIN